MFVTVFSSLFRVSPARIRAVSRSQVLEFRRDFGSVFLSFLFPMFFVVVLVASSLMSPRFTVDFGLVNAGAARESRQFAAALASENINFETLGREQALADLHAGKLAAVLVFPDEGLGNGTGRIELHTEQGFEGFGRQVIEAARARLLLPDEGREARFGYTVRTFEQESSTDFGYLFPGMLALALLQLGLFSTAMPLIRARERGTLRFLLLTPLTATELIAGQVAFRVGVGACQIVLLLVAGSFVLDIGIGAWLAVFGVSLLGVVMLVSIGYALAGLPRSADAGSVAILLANFVMMFGGNIFWNPEDSAFLTIFAHAMPVSYLADLYRQIIVGSEGLWSPAVDVAALAAFTVGAWLVAARTFSFDMRQREGRRASLPPPRAAPRAVEEPSPTI